LDPLALGFAYSQTKGVLFSRDKYENINKLRLEILDFLWYPKKDIKFTRKWRKQF